MLFVLCKYSCIVLYLFIYRDRARFTYFPILIFAHDLFCIIVIFFYYLLSDLTLWILEWILHWKWLIGIPRQKFVCNCGILQACLSLVFSIFIYVLFYFIVLLIIVIYFHHSWYCTFLSLIFCFSFSFPFPCSPLSLWFFMIILIYIYI